MTVSKSWEEHWEWSAIHSTMNHQLYEALHISTSRLGLLAGIKIRVRDHPVTVFSQGLVSDGV